MYHSCIWCEPRKRTIWSESALRHMMSESTRTPRTHGEHIECSVYSLYGALPSLQSIGSCHRLTFMSDEPFGPGVSRVAGGTVVSTTTLVSTTTPTVSNCTHGTWNGRTHTRSHIHVVRGVRADTHTHTHTPTCL